MPLFYYVNVLFGELFEYVLFFILKSGIFFKTESWPCAAECSYLYDDGSVSGTRAVLRIDDTFIEDSNEL